MILARGRIKIMVLLVSVLIIIGLAIAYYLSFQAPERKPAELRDKPYAYYQIIDEASGKTLTYVTTVAVTVGDEYLNEDGQWYQVVRVEENRAYARRFDKKR